MFSGSIPALVTPFRDGTFVEADYRKFIEWQIAEGSTGLVPMGTTGESATMTTDEHHHAIQVCVEQAAGRVPVIAGCGSNDTRTAIEHMRFSRQAGADAALVVLPYYNRPNQEGILAHFQALVDACDLPIVVYNVPARTVTDIMAETLAKVAALPGVVGIKDASGIIQRVTAYRLACPADFCQLSGNDDMALAYNAAGGQGCISVTANVAPRLCAEFQQACRDGRWDEARALNDRLYPLHVALFTDASPGPVKYALSRVMPKFASDLRLPMTPAGAASRAAVDAALATAGLA